MLEINVRNKLLSTKVGKKAKMNGHFNLFFLKSIQVISLSAQHSILMYGWLFFVEQALKLSCF